MNWRSIQLGRTPCDQDRVVLDLINGSPVRICGQHQGFDQFCQIDQDSDFCLIFLNEPLWLSEIGQRCAQYIHANTRKVYIGINRYQIKGNDTWYQSSLSLSPGNQVLTWFAAWLQDSGFCVKDKGCLEKDQGKYFNYVQPLTWIYAEHEIQPAR